MHKLILTLKDSFDASGIDGGEAFLKIEASSEDGTRAAVVTINFADDTRAFSAVVEGEAYMLPGVHGDMHLVSVVLGAVHAMFNDDHTFYSEVFSDADGETVTRTVEV